MQGSKGITSPLTVARTPGTVRLQETQQFPLAPACSTLERRLEPEGSESFAFQLSTAMPAIHARRIHLVLLLYYLISTPVNTCHESFTLVHVLCRQIFRMVIYSSPPNLLSSILCCSLQPPLIYSTSSFCVFSSFSHSYSFLSLLHLDLVFQCVKDPWRREALIQVSG